MAGHTPWDEIPRRRRLKKHTEHHGSSLNGKIALAITKNVGTMWCAYVFLVLAAMSFKIDWLLLLTQNLLPLVLLPVIMVGQNVQGVASDHRAEVTLQDIEAVLDKLNTQTQGGLTEVLEAIHGLGQARSS